MSLETEGLYVKESLFINGVLYVKCYFDINQFLALDAPDTSAQWLKRKIIRLPGFEDKFTYGCLGQSSGVLCYAKQEINECMVRIWSLEGLDKWVVKHDVSLTDVCGRDKLLSSGWRGDWYFYYVDVVAFDLEREIIILNHKRAHKMVSLSISTEKGSHFLKVRKS